jgi:hypothetical protein
MLAKMKCTNLYFAEKSNTFKKLLILMLYLKGKKGEILETILEKKEEKEAVSGSFTK